MNMQTEPIRLPAIVVSIALLVLIPAATALVEGADWRAVALIVLGGVTTLLGGAETARAFVDSPATRASRTDSPATRASRTD